MSILINGLDMPDENHMLFLRIYPDGKVTIDMDLKCTQIATATQVPSNREDIFEDLHNQLL